MAHPTERYFAKLESVSQRHYVYANTLVFANGDTFKLDFLAPTGVLGSTEYLSDSTDINRAYVILGNTGNFDVNPANISGLVLDGMPVGVGSPYPTDGKMHELKIMFSASATLNVLGIRFSLAESYNGTLSDAVATISGITTTNAIGLQTGNSEPSTEANNTLTYVNIPDANRELFKLGDEGTQWNNISPDPQELQAVIVLAEAIEPPHVVGGIRSAIRTSIRSAIRTAITQQF